jgi:hypothetical protein
MEHLVELVEDHSKFVTARDCHVDRGKKDTIKWKNDTETDYTIHFDDCPLEENDFTVLAHGEKGPFKLTTTLAKTYAYDISPPKAMSGSVMAADPNVIVH